jgi:hypothetical protein
MDLVQKMDIKSWQYSFLLNIVLLKPPKQHHQTGTQMEPTRQKKQKTTKKQPMQSVPITTNVVSSNPAQVGCTQYNMMW